MSLVICDSEKSGSVEVIRVVPEEHLKSVLKTVPAECAARIALETYPYDMRLYLYD